jgi:hypothetical protein
MAAISDELTACVDTQLRQASTDRSAVIFTTGVMRAILLLFADVRNKYELVLSILLCVIINILMVHRYALVYHAVIAAKPPMPFEMADVLGKVNNRRQLNGANTRAHLSLPTRTIPGIMAREGDICI